MTYTNLSKKLLFASLFSLLLVSCDKEGITKFKLTVDNQTSENVTISIDHSANYIGPNETKKMNFKVKGFVGELFDLIASENESGSWDQIDAAIFTPEDGGSYSYTVGSSNVTENVGNETSEKLVGEWMRSSGCINVNDEANYYRFNSNGSGYFFAADCSSACEDYGIYFYFDYTASSTTLNLDNNSVSDYCGYSSDTPPDESVSYSLSGDILIIGSNTYLRQ